MKAQQESWIWLGGATLVMATALILSARVTLAPDDQNSNQTSDSLQHIAERLGCDQAAVRRVSGRAYRPVDGPFGPWQAIDRLNCQDVSKAITERMAAMEENTRLSALNQELNREYNRAVEAEALAQQREEKALDLNAELRSELTDMTQTLGQRDETLSATRIRLSTVSQELEQLHRIRDGLQTRLSNLREDYALQTQALETSQTFSRELEAQLLETSEALLETQFALDAVQTAYEARGEEIEALDARIAELAGALSEAEENLTQSQATVLVRDQSLAVAVQKQAMADQARAELSEELALKTQTLSDTESELLARIEALEVAEAQIKNLDQEKSALMLERDLHLKEMSLLQGAAGMVAKWESTAEDLIAEYTFVREESALVVLANLFDPGSPDFNLEAQDQLVPLTQALLFLQDALPRDLDWAFLVRGHADPSPISTARFPSNWELSAARAASVVRYLTDAGIMPDRLQVTGQGEFQPPASGIGARRVTVYFQPLIYENLLANTGN